MPLIKFNPTNIQTLNFYEQINDNWFNNNDARLLNYIIHNYQINPCKSYQNLIVTVNNQILKFNVNDYIAQVINRKFKRYLQCKTNLIFSTPYQFNGKHIYLLQKNESFYYIGFSSANYQQLNNNCINFLGDYIENNFQQFLAIQSELAIPKLTMDFTPLIKNRLIKFCNKITIKFQAKKALVQLL